MGWDAHFSTPTFDITKCDEIFDLLVTVGQIIVHPILKTPPLKLRKKIGFCKYHNFWGHKTPQCVLFRDLVQKNLKEGILQFTKKLKASIPVDVYPLETEDAHYVEPVEILIVEATKGFEMEVDKGEKISIVVDANM